jgi:condensin-2 complex subunit D3
VRKQTLLSLTRLLGEDYVKWKGTLFYRFVLAVIDDSPEIRQTAVFCFISLLKGKNPLMFFSHFIELIFHLNDYKQHAVYNQFPQTEKERNVFDITGTKNRK